MSCKLIKSIITMFLILLFGINVGYTTNFDIRKYNNTEENIIIGCIDKNNITSKPLINSKGFIFCRYKNIILPKQSHLNIFDKIYGSNTLMIANRLALVNFESAFNEFAVSPGGDYGYIQIRNGKWALGEIEGVLHWLNNRRKEQSESLCQDVLNINTTHNYDDMYRCLLMRHNGRKTLINSYTSRAIATRNYYLEYFSNFDK